MGIITEFYYKLNRCYVLIDDSTGAVKCVLWTKTQDGIENPFLKDFEFKKGDVV